jgi:hypothetical protein
MNFNSHVDGANLGMYGALSGDHCLLVSMYQEWVSGNYCNEICHDLSISYRSLSMAREVRQQLLHVMAQANVELVSRS